MRISLGSGATLATDLIGGEHRQIIAPVTIANIPNVQLNHLVSLASGTEVRSLASVLNWPTTLTSLASGTEVRSLATILNWPTTLTSLASGTFVSLNPGTNYIGLVSISGSITTSAGAVTLYPGPNQIGSVTISNIPSVQLNHLTSLVSGTEVRSLATIMNFPAAYPVTNLVSVASINGLVDVKQNGTWTVQPGNTANSTPWLVTQSGGLLSLASGTEVRSLATILNWPTTLTSLASGTLVGLNPGTNVIGTATVYPVPNSLYTSLATVISAAAAATLVVPPSGKIVVVKDLFISSLGAGLINVAGANSSATTIRVPYTALATMGGYISNFGDSGLRIGVANDSLTFTLQSVATMSVMANVRFE